ncbi:MAG: hypothetical protein WB554_10530 [Desulfomonilaceae bacterium]
MTGLLVDLHYVPNLISIFTKSGLLDSGGSRRKDIPMDKNEMALAIIQVMNVTNTSLDTLIKKAPKGFWLKVSKLIGKDWGKQTNLSQTWKRSQKELIEIISSQSAKQLSALHSEPPSTAEQLTRDDVEQIVEKYLKKRLAGYEPDILNEPAEFELVPEPETVTGGPKGRRQDRKYEKISLTGDRNLWKIFRQKQKKLSCSAPRLMDSILWNFFGKPELSYAKSKSPADQS